MTALLRRPPLLLALLALAGAAAGCNDFTGTQSATVTLVNRSGLRIEYVFLSPCTDEDWGMDRLGPSEIVAVGATKQFPGLEPGCWDFRADLETGRQVIERGVELSGNEVHEWVVEPPQP